MDGYVGTEQIEKNVVPREENQQEYSQGEHPPEAVGTPIAQAEGADLPAPTKPHSPTSPLETTAEPPPGVQPLVEWVRRAGERMGCEEALEEVRALDGEVKSFSDLAARPEFPQLYGLLERGCTLGEAFKLANFDSLAKRYQETARQQVLNELQSKNHLVPTKSRGQLTPDAPPEVKREYRLLNPRASDGEIQAHYYGYLRSREV